MTGSFLFGLLEFIQVPSRLPGSQHMTGRLGIRDQLPGDRFMATVRNLQYPPYDVRRSRKLAQRCRVMFTGGQLSQLEKYFSIDPYPKLKDRRHIADLMGISERRVQVRYGLLSY